MVSQASEVIALLEPFANSTNGTNITLPSIEELAQDTVDTTVRLVGQELQTRLKPLDVEMNLLFNLTDAALEILNGDPATKAIADQIDLINSQWDAFYRFLGALDEDRGIQNITDDVVEEILNTEFAMLFDQAVTLLPSMYVFTNQLIRQVENLVPIIESSMKYFSEVNENLPRSITIGSLLASIAIGFSLYMTWKGYCRTVLAVRGTAGYYAENFDLLRKAKVSPTYESLHLEFF